MPAFVIYGLADSGAAGVIRYVGKTGQRLSKRIGQHLYMARGGERTRRSCWIRSVLKAGRSIDVVVLDTLPTEVEANDREIATIRRLRDEGVDIVNLTNGGDGASGWTPTEEFINKMRALNVGKTLSAEHRRKMSVAKIGNRNLLGFRHSPETIAALSVSNRRTFTPEYRAKLSEAQRLRRDRERQTA